MLSNVNCVRIPLAPLVNYTPKYIGRCNHKFVIQCCLKIVIGVTKYKTLRDNDGHNYIEKHL